MRNPGGEGEPGSASAGEVLWSLEGEGDSAVVVIDATIPDKKMSFHITMKKNQDAELPASHLIEISATHADADPSKAIVKIPGLILKPTEQSRGEGLVGASIRIADDLHWVCAHPRETAKSDIIWSCFICVAGLIFRSSMKPVVVRS